MNQILKSKKGFIPLFVGIALLIVIVIAGIVLSINVLANKNLIFYIIGGGVIALSLIYVVPKAIEGEINNKKIGLILGIMGVGVVIILLASSGVMQQTYMNSDNYFEKPYFATIKCTSTTGVQESGDITKADSFTYKGNTYPGMWLSDKLPKNTDIWNIKVSSSDWTFFTTSIDFMYIVCPTRNVDDTCIDGGITNLQSSADFKTFTVASSKYVFTSFKTHILGSQRTGNYVVTYNSYNLELTDIFRGGVQKVPNTIGCIVPTSDIGWQKRIISTTDNTIKTTTASNSLQPGEYFNYVAGTVTARKDGNIQNNGYCVYNNGEANIYKINTITTPTDSYNIVDTNTIIGTPQCCNGLAYPDGRICQNGVFIEIENKECTYSSQCGSLEWNRDLTTPLQVIKYSCINNKCVSQTKKVECTINNNCASNEICDRNTWECINAGTTSSDNTNATNTCNKWYQEQGVQTTVIRSWYNYIGIGTPKTVSTPVCKTASWVNLIIIMSFVVILVIIIVLLLKDPKSKKKKF